MLVYDVCQSRGRAEHAVAKNFRAQAAATFQEFVRAGSDGGIHPVAWAAFLYSVKTNALNFKILANQLVQIAAAGDHVASRESRRTVVDLQRSAKFIEDFLRKKCDLSFVIVFEIEVAVAPNPPPRCAFDYRHRNHRVRVRLAAVMTDKIVPR